MDQKPTKEQMAEKLRQKLTDTVFWLYQAAGTIEDPDAVKDIERVIGELEKLDVSVAKAFKESGSIGGDEKK